MRTRATAALAALAATSALAACGGGSDQPPPPATSSAGGMRLTSPDFDGGGELPAELTCDGRGRSPALEISGVPAGATELAVIASDPDAPGGTYYHGAIYGLDPDTSEIPAGGVPDGAEVAANDAGTAGYAAPCPPEGDGPHHYTFSVYAVDQPLGLTDGADAAEVASAAEAAAVATASVSAAYER